MTFSLPFPSSLLKLPIIADMKPLTQLRKQPENNTGLNGSRTHDRAILLYLLYHLWSLVFTSDASIRALIFHRENEVDTSTSTRIKMFPFPCELALMLALVCVVWKRNTAFALVTRRPCCPRRPKKLCFTTPSLAVETMGVRLGVVNHSFFGLPGQ